MNCPVGVVDLQTFDVTNGAICGGLQIVTGHSSYTTQMQIITPMPFN